MTANANDDYVQQLRQIMTDRITFTQTNSELLRAHLDLGTGDAVSAPPARPSASEKAVLADYRRMLGDEAALTARLAQPMQDVPSPPATQAAINACSLAAAQANAATVKAVQALAATASRPKVTRDFPGSHHSFAGDPSTEDQHNHSRAVHETHCAIEDALNGISGQVLDSMRSNDTPEVAAIAETVDEIRKIATNGKSLEREHGDRDLTANLEGWPIANLAHGRGESRDADLTKRIKEAKDSVAKAKEEKAKEEARKKTENKDRERERKDGYDKDRERNDYKRKDRDFDGGGGGRPWFGNGNRGGFRR